jgi:hypothetical protein
LESLTYRIDSELRVRCFGPSACKMPLAVLAAKAGGGKNAGPHDVAPAFLPVLAGTAGVLEWGTGMVAAPS